MPDARPPAAAPPAVPPPSHPVRSVLVVGAGLAGARTVAALREHGFDGRVTLLGRETRDPYDRPPLSKHLLDRPEPAWLRDELGVDVHTLADTVQLGTSADHLAVVGDGVVVRAGAADVRADAVVLATGSRAVRPADWGDAVTLHTADDAAGLRARLVPGARLVVVGAGWIGAEVAGVASAAGVDVTVVEATTAPLSAALGARVGDLTAGWYAAAGVRLELGAEVTGVSRDGVGLADGRRLPADVVLAAVGARPDTGWLDGSLPRDPDGSLRVDAGYGVVGAPGHVRAVGDVARRWSARHGWVPGGHWDGALRGPATAVRALLGASSTTDDHEDPAPYVFSTQLGHDLTLLGQQGPGDELVLRGDPAGGAGWGALWFAAPAVDDDGGPGRALTAMLAVDRPRDVAAGRRLFGGPVLPRLDPAVAADATRGLRDAVVR
ncbi:NAD(P)/FAD-dependent oxidoreductase [uncultured Cellulomonas sp.]|uniref:NAD(P)/FAD-dependent oxidoreductase n=1 Tax=uncultured Cellulomonas sp. TaxID=189682 RepID=UPI00260D4D95|nr:FAD-dependent oxidoreductase [uncultured Cellulomonas sp.]